MGSLVKSKDADCDYTLKKGHSCWITVGKKSIYITQHPRYKKIQVFRLNHEDEDPEMEYEL